MTVVLVVVVVIALAAVVAVLVTRSRAGGGGRRPGGRTARVDPLMGTASPAGDPHHIGVGDVIAYDGHDWVVRGSVSYDQRGYRWAEHLLDRVGEQFWLSVEEDEQLQLVRWQAVRAATLEPTATVQWEGATFELEERGRARFRAEGTTGMAPEGEVEYHDYEAPDGRLLSFERTGDTTFEVSVGEPIAPGAMTIFPGTGA
ncbi:MAG: DUF4178 domain-containing protein [Acidimicrobiia bacterium]